jgi:hypothetical protein
MHEDLNATERDSEPQGAASDAAALGPVSGLYALKVVGTLPAEELRLDVDGLYPQMTASGVVPQSMASVVSWIAQLTPAGTNRWTGNIWFKDPGPAGFPYTNVSVTALPAPFAHLRKVKVIFSGGGPSRQRTYKFASQYFHPVEFEFDRAANLPAASAVTSIQTHAHPNRPGTLTNEKLTIETVFQRAGFDVRRSGQDNIVPLSIAGGGAGPAWSDTEMHDAMQTFWSRFSNTAQWSMWVLYASMHETGSSLGGVMFDDIGPNHRQGTAIFEDAFIATAPPGDPASAAWVSRMPSAFMAEVSRSAHTPALAARTGGRAGGAQLHELSHAGHRRPSVFLC